MVVVAGARTFVGPEPTKAPAQLPEYHLQKAFDPKLPPITDKVVVPAPVQRAAGEALAEAATIEGLKGVTKIEATVPLPQELEGVIVMLPLAAVPLKV